MKKFLIHGIYENVYESLISSSDETHYGEGISLQNSLLLTQVILIFLWTPITSAKIGLTNFQSDIHRCIITNSMDSPDIKQNSFISFFSIEYWSGTSYSVRVIYLWEEDIKHERKSREKFREVKVTFVYKQKKQWASCCVAVETIQEIRSYDVGWLHFLPLVCYYRLNIYCVVYLVLTLELDLSEKYIFIKKINKQTNIFE